MIDLDLIVPEHREEVRQRVIESCIKKQKKYVDVIARLEELQLIYFEALKRDPMLPDYFGYEEKINSAKYWFNKFEEENAEYLV